MQKWHHKSTTSPRFSVRISSDSAPHLISTSFDAGRSSDVHDSNQNIPTHYRKCLCRYFPKGGGHCIIHTKPVNRLHAAEIVDFGEVKNFFGWCFVAGTLPPKLADEMVAGAKQAVRLVQHNRPINVEAYKETPEMARDNCSGIM